MANAGNMVESLLQRIGEIPDFLLRVGTNYKTKSLIDVTQPSRVEPLTVVSKDCLTLEYLPDVMQSLLSIFAGYYLQAVALSARIDNVRVIRILDRLNPDRKFNDLMIIKENLEERINLSAESYRHRLPTSTNVRAMQAEMKRLVTRNTLATEVIDTLKKVNIHGQDDVEGLDQPTGHVDNDMITKVVNEVSNLSVGKLINVDIRVDEARVTVPVNLRLSAATLPDRSFTHILAMKTEDNTLVERFHAWRAGRIGLIKDLIFCQDLIDTHKKALMNDEDGVYSEIVKRVNNTKKFGILSNNPSLVSASNLFVMSEEVAKQVEQKLGGKLSNARIRQKAFENTYAMILVVIDREWERVTFYHRGISQSTEVSIKDIRASNKNKGPDVMDILKSYNMGQAPSF